MSYQLVNGMIVDRLGLPQSVGANETPEIPRQLIDQGVLRSIRVGDRIPFYIIPYHQSCVGEVVAATPTDQRGFAGYWGSSPAGGSIIRTQNICDCPLDSCDDEAHRLSLRVIPTQKPKVQA